MKGCLTHRFPEPTWQHPRVHLRVEPPSYPFDRLQAGGLGLVGREAHRPGPHLPELRLAGV